MLLSLYLSPVRLLSVFVPVRMVKADYVCCVTFVTLGWQLKLSLLRTVAVKHFSTTQIVMSGVNAITLTANNRLRSYGHGFHFMAFPFISFAPNSTECLEMLHCSV